MKCLKKFNIYTILALKLSISDCWIDSWSSLSRPLSRLKLVESTQSSRLRQKVFCSSIQVSTQPFMSQPLSRLISRLKNEMKSACSVLLCESKSQVMSRLKSEMSRLIVRNLVQMLNSWFQILKLGCKNVLQC